MNLPQKIKLLVGDLPYKIDDIGRSGDTILFYGDKYVLKISNDCDRVRRECQKLRWFEGKLPTAKVIEYIEENGKSYLLETKVQGVSLINVSSDKVINLLIEAISLLNDEKLKQCPFKSQDNQGKDFVHGDLCLPNIMTDGKKITGFIDLDNSGLGDKLYDISWACWSLLYNLKDKKYIEEFLQKLKIDLPEEKYKQYVDY